MRHRCRLALCSIATLVAVSPASAQQADSSLLSLDRIFNSPEFAPERLGPVRWLPNAAAYVKLEADSTTPNGRSLVRYDAATGKREVWIAANRLTPQGDSMPLAVENYEVSPDGSQLLVFTNSQKVWRENTRGDFWAFDLASGRLRKLGGS